MVSPSYEAETLTEVLERVDQIRCDNRDYYVQLRDLRFEVANHLPAPPHEQIALACSAYGVPPDIRLREDGWTRVLRYLGLPARLGERLPAAMVASSLNYVLASRADEMVLVRLRHQDERAILRGLLPPSHVRLDDRHIVEQLRRLPGTDAMRPVNVTIREDAFHLRLINRRQSDVGRSGQQDPVHPGLDVYNSETGAGPLAIGRCLFRVVCANGLVFRESVGRTRRWRHTGRDADALREQLAEAMRLSLADVNSLTDRYRQLHAVTVEEPGTQLEAFMRIHKLGSPRGRTGERILLEMTRSTNLFGQSLFDFVQAVTAVARTLDVDKRLRFEAAAGQIVVDGEVIASNQ